MKPGACRYCWRYLQWYRLLWSCDLLATPRDWSNTTRRGAHASALLLSELSCVSEIFFVCFVTYVVFFVCLVVTPVVFQCCETSAGHSVSSLWNSLQQFQVLRTLCVVLLTGASEEADWQQHNRQNDLGLGERSQICRGLCMINQIMIVYFGVNNFSYSLNSFSYSLNSFTYSVDWCLLVVVQVIVNATRVWVKLVWVVNGNWDSWLCELAVEWWSHC